MNPLPPRSYETSPKTRILELLRESFERDLHANVDSAKSAYEAATHAESRSDNKYDTRGLEASYLAGAQAQRAQEIRKLLGICAQLKIRDFTEDEAIAVGALVEIAGDGGKQWIFLVPFAGGRSVEVEGRKIGIVSSASPLGQELVSRVKGDVFNLELKGHDVNYRVLQVL